MDELFDYEASVRMAITEIFLKSDSYVSPERNIEKIDKYVQYIINGKDSSSVLERTEETELKELINGPKKVKKNVKKKSKS